MEPQPGLTDYRLPLPDLGHEAIRAPLAAAIDELADTVARLEQAIADLAEARADVGRLKNDVADLHARIPPKP